MNKNISWKVFFILLCCIGLTACQENRPTPKPRGYPRVYYPEKEYQVFESTACNFEFQYPVYAQIVKDSLFFDERIENPCWFDLYFPPFDCQVHCSHYTIDGENTFEKLREDSYKLAYKHVVKANAIEEVPVKNEYGVEGYVFNMEGPVASFYNFYLTDYEENFIRGSLYFNTEVRPDSLAPVFDFVKEDLNKMIETFRWKD